MWDEDRSRMRNTYMIIFPSNNGLHIKVDEIAVAFSRFDNVSCCETNAFCPSHASELYFTGFRATVFLVRGSRHIMLEKVMFAHVWYFYSCKVKVGCLFRKIDHPVYVLCQIRQSVQLVTNLFRKLSHAQEWTCEQFIENLSRRHWESHLQSWYGGQNWCWFE